MFPTFLSNLLQLKLPQLKTTEATVTTHQPMAEPQQEEWADAAANDESLSSKSTQLEPLQAPSAEVSQVLAPPPQNVIQLTPSLLFDPLSLNLPDLPDLELEHSLQNVINLVPPPPPPPPRDLLSNEVPIPIHTAPLPPPPPPPSTTASTSRQVRIAQPASLPQLGETHSNLMAAIRSAGGAERAGLRSIRSSSFSFQTKTPNHVSGSDELMKELREKLNMRRHSVSGRSICKGAASSSSTVRKTNAKKIERHCEATSSHSGRANPLFSHLSAVMPKSTVSSLQFKAPRNDNGSDNENEEDWFD